MGYLFRFALLILLVMSSCQSKPAAQTVTSESVALPLSYPLFNADSAFAFMERQVSVGPRVPGSQAHSSVATYLSDQLRNYGATVVVQEFEAVAYDGSLLQGKNIIGSFLPDNPKRILLCAHWDSRPFADYDLSQSNRRLPVLGANDGASGVGVLLEIARHLADSLPKIGVDIVFFDLEDYGTPSWEKDRGQDTWALGSQYWSQHPHTSHKHQYGILLDMVGGKNAQFKQEMFSKQYAPQIVKRVWKAAHELGFGTFFPMTEGSYITDDHYYINQIGIPTIDIIEHNLPTETGFVPQWHTIDDTMQHISRESLYAVGQTVLYIVFQ